MHSSGSIYGDLNKQSNTFKNIFEKILNKLKYNALSLKKVPFIFAYTALVNDDIVNQTKEAGFDECFLSPLTNQKVELIVKEFIDKTCQKIIQDKFFEAFSENPFFRINSNIFEVSNQESSYG